MLSLLEDRMGMLKMYVYYTTSINHSNNKELQITNCDRLNTSPTKTPVLIPGTCDYVMSHCSRDSVEVIKDSDT